MRFQKILNPAFAENFKKVLTCTYGRILLYSHGFGEYFCPSYDGIAEALVNNGYLVFGHDHIGHGRSTGQRVQVKSMDEYVLPLLGTIHLLCQHFYYTKLNLTTEFLALVYFSAQSHFFTPNVLYWTQILKNKVH